MDNLPVTIVLSCELIVAVLVIDNLMSKFNGISTMVF